MSASLTALYTGAESGSVVRLTLEQEPVADNSLTLDDLEAMLALVRSGLSAQSYRPASCPASVVAGVVIVPLDLWVWPVPLDLDYTLSPNLGVISAASAVEIEREFDLVIDFSRRVELPFLTSALTWEWSDLPCFDRMSNEVERPAVTVEPAALVVDAEIMGVLRIKCTAIGYLHTLRLDFAKGTDAITDIKAAVTASWRDNGETITESIDLKLPGCVEQLLASCPDGTRKREAAMGSVTDEEEVRPVVYYNDCDGSVMAVRYERP